MYVYIFLFKLCWLNGIFTVFIGRSDTNEKYGFI